MSVFGVGVWCGHLVWAFNVNFFQVYGAGVVGMAIVCIVDTINVMLCDRCGLIWDFLLSDFIGLPLTIINSIWSQVPI